MILFSFGRNNNNSQVLLHTAVTALIRFFFRAASYPVLFAIRTDNSLSQSTNKQKKDRIAQINQKLKWKIICDNWNEWMLIRVCIAHSVRYCYDIELNIMCQTLGIAICFRTDSSILSDEYIHSNAEYIHTMQWRYIQITVCLYVCACV